MDRELVLGVLVLAIAGPVMLAFGARRPRVVDDDCAGLLARRLWAALLTPVLTAAVAVAALAGWAVLEPEHAESVPTPWIVVAVPFALVWCRALARAVRAAMPPHAAGPAETVGLLRPRVRIAPELAAVLDDTALAAAVAHEEAHARRRDPLRIWAAQLATDLQWPMRAANERFEAWAAALELARDEDARRGGVDGADLAAAVVAAARLQHDRRSAVAGLAAGDAALLRDRVDRLLAPLAEPLPWARPWRHAIAGGMVVAVVLGAIFGESLVRLILLGQA